MNDPPITYGFSLHVVKSRADIEKEIASLEAMIGKFQLEFGQNILEPKGVANTF